MFLNSAQIQELKAIFASVGINNSDFNYNNQGDLNNEIYCYKK